MSDYIKRIARRVRGQDRRIQTLEEERQPNVEPVVIRRMFETAVSEENMTITAVEDPVALFDETDFNRSEFGTDADQDSNTVISEETVSNTTCIELDEYRAEDMIASTTNDDANEFGVGTGDTDPAYDNRTLNEPATDDDGENVTFTIDEFEIDGTTAIMNGFLGTQQANGETLVETNVVSSEGRQYNHATHSPINKTNAVSVTYEAQFSFDTASGGS